MSQSNRNPRSDKPTKPAKPYADFPLFPHATGRWAKKIKGRMCYFGPWEDWQGALDKYLAEKDDLYAGRRPRAEKAGGFTVEDLADHFLTHKQHLRDSGELSPRTWDDYKNSADVMVEHFGKARLVSDLRAQDFTELRVKLSRKWGPVRLGNVIQRVRSVCNYAFDAEHIDKPIRFGPGFVRPSKKTMRIARAKEGPKLFSRDDVHKLLDKATVQMQAMILLGVNAGYGNADVARLPLTALDLDRGIAVFPRPKTGIDRRCVLWPETVQAIRAALAERPQPAKKEYAKLVFMTPTGGTWHSDGPFSPITGVFRAVLRAGGITGRKGLGFYTLRHVHRTVADGVKDQPAADLIMGHETPGMAAEYRETIGDERLQAISDYIRAWLFAPAKGEPPADVDLGDEKEDEPVGDDEPALLAFPRRCPA